MAIAHGLKQLELPASMKVILLGTHSLAEAAFASLLAPLDNTNTDDEGSLCVSLDAEWNMSRTIGISVLQIAPHSLPDIIYIIPVSHQSLEYI